MIWIIYINILKKVSFGRKKEHKKISQHNFCITESERFRIWHGGDAAIGCGPAKPIYIYSWISSIVSLPAVSVVRCMVFDRWYFHATSVKNYSNECIMCGKNVLSHFGLFLVNHKCLFTLSQIPVIFLGRNRRQEIYEQHS